MQAGGYNTKEAVDTFVEETLSRLTTVRQLITETGMPKGRVDHSRVNMIFREVHSLKAASNLLGFSNIEEICHGLEDVLVGFREGSLVPDRYIESVLQDTLDTVEQLVRNVRIIKALDVSSQTRKLSEIAKSRQL